MRRNINLFLTLILFATFNSVVCAQDFNQKYKLIRPAQPTQTDDKIEVLEVFSYACPHCYSFDPFIEKWMETKPEYVEFRRMPALFGGLYVILAKAYYTVEKMGVLEKVHQPLFDALHRQKQKLFREEDLKNFFVKLGVDGNEFTRIFNSREIDIKIKQARAMAGRYGVNSVPTMIVNGKYLTYSGLADSNKNILEVVDQLIAIEKGQ